MRAANAGFNPPRRSEPTVSEAEERRNDGLLLAQRAYNKVNLNVFRFQCEMMIPS